MVGPCVFSALQSVGKCLGVIHSQPADYSGAPALVCVRNLCASGFISIHIYVLRHHVSGFKALCVSAAPPPSQGESLQFKSLIFLCDCTNIIREGLGRRGGSAPTSRTNRQTPGVLWRCHYGSTRLYTSSLDQNKAGHFMWLNQAGCASQTHCGSESLPTLL